MVDRARGLDLRIQIGILSQQRQRFSVEDQLDIGKSASPRQMNLVGPVERRGPGTHQRDFLLLCAEDRKSTRLNSSHLVTSYAVFCLKKKKKDRRPRLLRRTSEVRRTRAARRRKRGHPAYRGERAKYEELAPFDARISSPFFFKYWGAHRDLHSFPTRRSSD